MAPSDDKGSRELYVLLIVFRSKETGGARIHFVRVGRHDSEIMDVRLDVTLALSPIIAGDVSCCLPRSGRFVINYPVCSEIDVIVPNLPTVRVIENVFNPEVYIPNALTGFFSFKQFSLELLVPTFPKVKAEPTP